MVIYRSVLTLLDLIYLDFLGRFDRHLFNKSTHLFIVTNSQINKLFLHRRV